MSFVLLTFTSRHFGCGLSLLDWLLVLFLIIWLGLLCLAVGINWVSCQILASRPDEKLVSVNSPDRWIALCWPGNNSTARTFINVEVLRSDNAFVTESRTTDAGKKKVQQQWTNKSCQHGEHCTMFHILLWEHRHCLFSEGMEQHMQRSVYRFTTEFTNTHTLSWFLSMHIPRYVGLWQHMQSQIKRKKILQLRVWRIEFDVRCLSIVLIIDLFLKFWKFKVSIYRKDWQGLSKIIESANIQISHWPIGQAPAECAKRLNSPGL